MRDHSLLLPPYVEGRAGLAGLIYDSDEPVSGGLLAGARLQSPTRLAPFLGIGAYAGVTPELALTRDGIDNDFDGTTDNGSEAENSFVGALIPEAGCHFWLNPAWRITGSASYYLTTSGPEDNFLMISVSLAWLSDLGKTTSQRALISRTRELGWQPGDGPGSEYPIANKIADTAPFLNRPLQLSPATTAPAVIFPWEITESDSPTEPDYTNLH